MIGSHSRLACQEVPRLLRKPPQVPIPTRVNESYPHPQTLFKMHSNISLQSKNLKFISYIGLISPSYGIGPFITIFIVKRKVVLVL
jgi:hypothetical protein